MSDKPTCGNGRHYFSGGGKCLCGEKAEVALIPNDHLEKWTRERADLVASNERLTAALGAAHRALEAQRDADWHFARTRAGAPSARRARS